MTQRENPLNPLTAAADREKAQSPAQFMCEELPVDNKVEGEMDEAGTGEEIQLDHGGGHTEEGVFLLPSRVT